MFILIFGYLLLFKQVLLFRHVSNKYNILNSQPAHISESHILILQKKFLINDFNITNDNYCNDDMILIPLENELYNNVNIQIDTSVKSTTNYSYMPLRPPVMNNYNFEYIKEKLTKCFLESKCRGWDLTRNKGEVRLLRLRRNSNNKFEIIILWNGENIVSARSAAKRLIQSILHNCDDIIHSLYLGAINISKYNENLSACLKGPNWVRVKGGPILHARYHSQDAYWDIVISRRRCVTFFQNRIIPSMVSRLNESSKVIHLSKGIGRASFIAAEKCESVCLASYCLGNRRDACVEKMRESLETRLNKKLPNFIHKTFSTFDQLEKNIKNHDTMIFDDSFFRAWIDYTKDKKYYILRLSTINNIILETYRPTILVQMLSEIVTYGWAVKNMNFHKNGAMGHYVAEVCKK
eukprot:GHVL01041814.1.p1 GENE.GHVL01041814.1~~GHVL01041814.1.p1  ORF type:complete len:408 (+),score=53.33 GHVL01041814.1:25-1248(+)